MPFFVPHYPHDSLMMHANRHTFWYLWTNSRSDSEAVDAKWQGWAFHPSTTIPSKPTHSSVVSRYLTPLSTIELRQLSHFVNHINDRMDILVMVFGSEVDGEHLAGPASTWFTVTLALDSECTPMIDGPIYRT